MHALAADPGIVEVQSLPFWTGPISVWPLTDGPDNRSYGVQQADGQRFAVRLGRDRPQHGIMRFNEQEAARAAAKSGLSPRLQYAQPGVLVTRMLPGRSLSSHEVREPENLARIVALLQHCHSGMAKFLTGPLLSYWVFHANRSYAAALERACSRMSEELPRLMSLNDSLERQVGKIEVGFTHNNLTAANIFDDGARLWLLDWECAGFNTPIFDLARLSASNGFYPSDDARLLELYYRSAPDRAMQQVFRAFKCASLLRDALGAELDAVLNPAGAAHTQIADHYLLQLEVALAELA